MKLLISIVLFGICTFGNIQGQIISEKISFEAENTTIEDILNQLTVNYGISFSYSKDFLLLENRVSINRVNTSIGAIIDEIITHQPIVYKVIGNIIVFKKVQTSDVNKTATEGKQTKLVSYLSQSPNKIKKGKTARTLPISFDKKDTLDISKKGIITTTKKDNQEKKDPTISPKTKITSAKSIEKNEMDFRMTRLVLQKAFEKIEDNFQSKPYLFKGYYREIIEENKKAISLVDAAVEIYDRGYKVKKKGKKQMEKVMLRGVRTSNSKMKDSFKTDFQNFNSLSALLRWNKIKYHPENINSIIGKKQYKLDSIIQSSNGMTYVISSLISTQSHELKSTYHIDALSHSFLKVIYEDNAKNGYYLNQKWRSSDDRLHFIKAKKTLLVYEFKDHEGKMYLSKCSENSYADIYNKKSKSVEWEFGCSRVLLISQVENWQSKSKNSKGMDDSMALSQQITSYNPMVWNQFDNLNLIPLSEEQTQSLEINLPLLEQYLNNAKK